MFKQLVRMVLFCSIIMLIGCPSPTGNKDTTAPSLAATQDGIRDGDTTFQIRFTEAVQKVSGQTLANGITVAVNGASPAAVSSASINSDTRYVDISFPAVKGGDKVVIVIKQGFLQDAAGNKNSQLTMPTITVGAASSDNTPPALAPVQEDLVSGSRSYTLTFTEDLVMAVDSDAELAAGVKKVVGGTEYTATAAFIDPNDSTKVVIAFSNEFNQGESVTFKIEANLLKDSSDNRNGAIESSPVSVADKAPGLEGLQAELINGDTDYTIKFDEELTLAPGVTDLTAKIQIAVNSGTAGNVATAAIDDADQSRVAISWTTPVSTDDAVRITIAAGAFQDSGGNANPALSIDKTVAATADETPPAVATTQTIEAGSSTSTVAFTEPVKAVEGADLEAGISLIAPDGPINAQYVEIDSADRTQVTISFASVLNYPGQMLDLDIDAGLFQDASGNKNLALTLSVEVLDTTPPALDPEQADLEAGSTSYSIKFSESLSLVSGADLAAGIKVTIDGTEEAVNSAAIDISEVDIILASAADLGDTVSLTVDAGLLEDYSDNQNAAISAALTVVDTTGPALASAQANLEAHSTEYTIEFTEAVELVTTASDLAAGITLSIDGTDASPLAASIDDADQKLVRLTLGATAQASQTVTFAMAADLLKDTHNNHNKEISATSITVTDSTGPKLQPVQAGINNSETAYTIRFNENLVLGDGVTDLKSKIQVSVNGTSTSASTAAINGTNVDITFAIVTTGQTVDITIEADALKDAAGNHNLPLSVPTITVTATGDTTKPVLADPQNDLTAGSPSYTITFDEPVALVGSNLAAGITFTINGDALTVQSALIDSQDPRLVKVLLTTAASYGDTVSFTIAADKLKDAAGNQNESQTSSSLTVADGTGPALAPLQDHLEAGTTSYTIKFTEPLALVSTEDALTAGTKVSINGASETAVQSAEINTVDTKNVDITLDDSLSVGDTISFTMEAGLLEDAANNQNGAIPATNIDVRDTIPPAVADGQDEFVAGSVQYTIRFTEPVFEVDSAKTKEEIFFQIGRPTGVEDKITGVIEAVKDVRIDDVDPALVHVTLSETASVDPDGTADTVKRSLHPSAFKDAAGNENIGLYPHSDNYSQIIVADRTLPALAADQDDFVSGSTEYTLKFTEHVSEVSGATLADGVQFFVNGQGVSVSNAAARTDSALIDVTLASPVTGEDSLTFTMDAGVLEDKAGNGNAAIPSTSIEVVDTTGPALAGTSAELEAGTTSYTVTFDEEVFPAGTAKQLADGIKFTIGGTEKSSTAAVIDSVNPESVRITLASAAAFGDGVSLKIAAGLLKDSKGNLNEEITIDPVTVSDTIGPKLQPVQAELVNGAEYTIAFNENLVLADGVTLASEIQVGGTNAQTASIDGTDASLVKITFTAVTAGTVDITIAAGALKDGQDNHNSALTLSGITVSASADTTPPAPAGTQANLEAGSTSYSIKFTEPVALVSTEAALAAGLKFTIGGGSAASVSAARVDADDPSIVHVTLASAATGDSASFTIDAGLLKDAAGNENEATPQAIGLTIADTTGPALAGEQEELEARGTEYRITFTEPVSPVDTEAALAAGITISIDGTDVEVAAASIDAADGKYVDITLASGANLGSNVNLSVSENLLKDAADNQNAATPTIGITVADTSGPKLLPQQDDIAELDRYYKLRFDENLELYSGVDQAALTAGILIDVGTRLTDIGARNPAIDEDDPTIVHIELPTVIEGESVTIRIAADLFTDAHDNPNNGGQTFTKTIQAQVRGVVRTLAGQLRVRNNGDGDNVNGAEATLGQVLALIVDGNKIYAVDSAYKNNTYYKSIRMIDEFGAVSTIIDSGRLNDPWGLALYGTDLYVSDRGIRQILKFNLSDPANIPTAEVVAGDSSTTGRVDGTGISASFNEPKTLAINGNGDTLYVIDRHHIREINLNTKEVTTIAGGGNASHGNGLDTAFYFPDHLTIDSAGKYLYVSDTYHHQIKRIDLESADKTVTIVAGSGVQGYFNAYGTNAEFSYPFGICLDAAEEYLFVVDQNDLIRRITLSNSKVEYLAGVRYKDFQTATGEGSLSEMEFGRAKKLTVGSGNFLYVGDDLLFTVMKLYLP